MRGLFGVAAAAAFAVASSQWIGETFVSSPAGNAVLLNQLNANAQITGQLASIPVQQETITTDTFRCVPGGAYCMFLTSVSSGGGQQATVLYNVTDTTGAEVGRIPLGPIAARTLHVDMNSGTVFSLASINGGKGAAVVSVVGNAPAQVIADLSRYYSAGSVLKSTHCSNTQTMWAAITNGTAGGSLIILSVATQPAKILAVQPLDVSFNAMWAYCNEVNGQDLVGGTVVSSDGTTLQYGTVSPAGDFVPGTSTAVPAGYTPSGLLSAPENYDFFATLYPTGTGPASKTGGYIAQWNEGSPSMTLSPMTYFLSGAATNE